MDNNLIQPSKHVLPICSSVNQQAYVVYRFSILVSSKKGGPSNKAAIKYRKDYGIEDAFVFL